MLIWVAYVHEQEKSKINIEYLFVTICIKQVMDIDKKNPIKSKNWSCVKHPGCLYSIPCDCYNCIAFEKMLHQRRNQYESKKKPQSEKCKRLDVAVIDSRIIS